MYEVSVLIKEVRFKEETRVGKIFLKMLILKRGLN